MDRNLKISVVTVCYNAVDTIEETILSVINQTYDNVEYIIIDGGSTDSTVDIIRKYADGGSEALNHRHRITYWVSESDRGIYDAMNKGIAVATGDYINFMNAGDTFIDSITLDSFADRLRGEEASIVYGNWIVSDLNGSYHRNPYPLTRLHIGSCLCHQATFYCTNLLKKRSFQTQYRIAGDYEYACYLYTNNYPFIYLDIEICNYSADGISDKQGKTSLKEAFEISSKYFPNRKNHYNYCKSLIYINLKSIFQRICGDNIYKLIKAKKKNIFL